MEPVIVSSCVTARLARMAPDAIARICCGAHTIDGDGATQRRCRTRGVHGWTSAIVTFDGLRSPASRLTSGVRRTEVDVQARKTASRS